MLVLLALFLVAEVVFRIAYPQPLGRLLRNVYIADDSGRHYLPGARTICNNGFGDHDFSINSWRVRDKEYGPKQPGEWRILCMGDSFVDNIALDVEQIYPNVLEEDLARRYPDRQYSVVSAGMAGWALWSYYKYLDEMLPEIDPDVVVVNVNVAADSSERARSGPPRTVPRRLIYGIPVHRDSSPMQRAAWGIWLGNELLENYSHAFVAFRRATRIPFTWLRIGPHPCLHPVCTDPEAAERVLEPTIATIAQVKRLCDERGVAFVLMNVPRVYEVNEENRWTHIQMENPDLRQLDVGRPRKMFRRAASVLGVPAYDPTDDLAASGEPTYFHVFEHWNARGNVIVADGLRRCLDQAGLLGRSMADPRPHTRGS
jgi:hypothetical protein